MAFAIEVALSAEQEMTELPVFEHRRIVDAIEQQLSGEPEKPTRNRKCLGDGMTADFEFIPPLWQLRVGEYRVRRSERRRFDGRGACGPKEAAG